MAGEEEELRTIETDSGIYDPGVTSEVTTDAKRTRNADRSKDSETDSGIYDPGVASGVTTDAKRTRNADRRKVCIRQWISDNKKTTFIIILLTIIIIVLSVLLGLGCGSSAVTNSSQNSQEMTGISSAHQQDENKANSQLEKCRTCCLRQRLCETTGLGCGSSAVTNSSQNSQEMTNFKCTSAR